MRTRLSPTEARRAAYDHAKRIGCTCRPDIAYRPPGVVEVAHDADCPLASAGQIMAISGAGLLPTSSTIAAAIEVALQAGVITMSAPDAALVVPDGIDVPPMVAEFAEIVRLEVDGRIVRICTIDDATAMHMGRNLIGGAR